MAWTTRFSEPFTGSDGTELNSHNAAWIRDNTGDMAINASNQCKTVGTGDDFFRRYHLSTSLADKQAFEIDLHDTGNFNGVGVRSTNVGTNDDWNGYIVFQNGGTMSLYERISPATFALKDSASVTWVAGDTLRIEADGSSLTAYQNGVQKVSGSDATNASGSANMRGERNIDPMFDNAKAEDEVAAGGGIAVLRRRIEGY